MITFRSKEKKITKTYRMKPSHIEFLEKLAEKENTSTADIIAQILDKMMEEINE